MVLVDQPTNQDAQAQSTSGTGYIAMPGLMPADIYDRVKDGVVSVDSYDPIIDEYVGGGGTGFMIDRTHLVTAYHVVVEAAEDPSIAVEVGTNSDMFCDGQVIGAEPDLDIAVISLDGWDCFEWSAELYEWVPLSRPNLTPLTIAYDGVDVGEWVMQAGYIFGYYPSLTVGIVSSPNYVSDLSGIPVIEHDAALGPGSSGGPLFNMWGEVVGMNIEGTNAGEYIAVALGVPIDAVMDVARDIISQDLRDG